MLEPAGGMSDGEAYELTAELARRGGICGPNDLFTLATLHDLEKNISHLGGVLVCAVEPAHAARASRTRREPAAL